MIRLRKLLPRSVLRQRRAHGMPQLHSIDRMRAILDRERMRSDRGNSVFSLVTLSFSTPLDEKQLSVLSRILGERLRATDDVGWLGTRQIGAVLPETRAPGAWKVADDICHLLPTPMRPDCDVYTYPQNREQPEHCTADSGLEPAEENRRARTMQTLFVRPLPLWKRGVDITGAITGLVVLAPLMLLAAVAIKATSRGPVLFAQRRHTLGGRSFTIYKFRTMCVDAEDHKAALRAFSEQDGPAFKMTNDPRVTRLGRFLRKTSIDELPQLFNVLRGDMSLVGPRPLPCDESNRCEAWQRRRLDVTPGLTCIWQIRGRSAVSFSEWVRMDVEYIRSRSLVYDLKLIVQTLPAVVLRRGAC